MKPRDWYHLNSDGKSQAVSTDFFSLHSQHTLHHVNFRRWRTPWIPLPWSEEHVSLNGTLLLVLVYLIVSFCSPSCDAEPDLVARYISALISSGDSPTKLRQILEEKLREFFDDRMCVWYWFACCFQRLKFLHRNGALYQSTLQRTGIWQHCIQRKPNRGASITSKIEWLFRWRRW